MVPKKEIKKLKQQISAIVSDKKTIEEKIEELDDLGDGSLSEEEKEFKSLVQAISRTKSMVKNVKTGEDLESSKKEIKSIVDRIQDLRKRLDEFEEKFQRYNIPKVGDSESLLVYVNKLQEFMKIWKQDVEKGREKGQKSLIEWLKQLSQSDQEQRKSTLEEMKRVVIKLGIQISHCFIEYFLLMTVSGDKHALTRKLDNVVAMLPFLSLEENSIVIMRFLSLVKLVEIKMMATQNCSMVTSEANVPYSDSEVDFLYLILREVLRLEVSLCCPTLPMMLIDEVYLSMGSHLLKLLEHKLNKVYLKMNELKMGLLSIRDGDEDQKTQNVLMGELDMVAKEIWNSLDLQSDQDYVPFQD